MRVGGNGTRTSKLWSWNLICGGFHWKEIICGLAVLGEHSLYLLSGLSRDMSDSGLQGLTGAYIVRNKQVKKTKLKEERLQETS